MLSESQLTFVMLSTFFLSVPEYSVNSIVHRVWCVFYTMSSSNRTTGRSGGKNTAVKKNESAPVVSKAHKNEAKKTESAHVTHKV